MSLTTELRAGYAPGVPPVISVTDRPVSALLDDAVRYYPSRVAIDYFGQTFTYTEFDQAVDRAVTVLQQLGVKPGDRVALVLPNCPQHMIAFYAIVRVGAIVAEHNPLAPTKELVEQLDNHGGKLVLAWEKSLAKVAPYGDTRGRKVLAVDLTRHLPRKSRLLLKLPVAAARTQREAMRGPVPAGVESWDKLVAQALPAQRQKAPRRGDDTAVLLHTGGTTGTPKAVELTHRNLTANAEMSARWVAELREGAEVFYAVLPFFHAFGLMLCMMAGIRMAASIVVFPKFAEDLVFDAMRQRPVTFFSGVPPMFARLTAEAKKRGVDMSSARYSISGAMALPDEVANEWEELTGGYLVEGYGMTEGSPIILGNPVSPGRKPGTLGIPFPSTEVRIVVPDTDEDVPAGEVGELIVRGPQVFKGYWNNPEESAEALRNGWLRTGDIVSLVDGHIVMADRRKELIISGGFNIYPSQVEEAVRSMPGIADVAVVGLPGGSRGESVVAALVLEAGARVNLEEVRRWAERSISHYALPRQIALVSELPRSQIGKVLRKRVREQLLAAQGQVNAVTSSPVFEQVSEHFTEVTGQISEHWTDATEHFSEHLADAAGQLSQVAEQWRSQNTFGRLTRSEVEGGDAAEMVSGAEPDEGAEQTAAEALADTASAPDTDEQTAAAETPRDSAQIAEATETKD